MYDKGEIKSEDQSEDESKKGLRSRRKMDVFVTRPSTLVTKKGQYDILLYCALIVYIYYN